MSKTSTTNTYYESFASSASYVASSIYSLTSTLAHNTMHTSQLALYLYVGAAILWEMPVLIVLSNDFSRCQETCNLVENDKHAIAHHHHEILANYIVNMAISFTGAAVAANFPGFSMPLLGVYTATDVMAGGENSPIDKIKDGLTGVLNGMFGDHF